MCTLRDGATTRSPQLAGPTPGARAYPDGEGDPRLAANARGVGVAGRTESSSVSTSASEPSSKTSVKLV